MIDKSIIRNKLIEEMSNRKKKLRINSLFNQISSFVTGSAIGLLIMCIGDLSSVIKVVAGYFFMLIAFWIIYTICSNHEVDKLVRIVIKNVKDINNEDDINTAIALVVRVL